MTENTQIQDGSRLHVLHALGDPRKANIYTVNR